MIGAAFSTVKAIVDGIASAIRTVKNLWDSWTPKIKTLTTKTQGLAADSGTGVKHATGTKASKGGTALVGERGPELVNLPKGASVHTARETSQMLASPSVTVNMSNNIAQNGLSIDEVVSQLSEKIAEAMSSSLEGVVA